MTYRPKIKIERGEVEGYGGPGYSWIKGVFDNRIIWSFSGSSHDITIESERARVKWEKLWPSKEAFLKAISRKKQASPLCSNCDRPIDEDGCSCLEKYWCSRAKCQDVLDIARKAYEKKQIEYREKLANDLAQQKIRLDEQRKNDQAELQRIIPILKEKVITDHRGRMLNQTMVMKTDLQIILDFLTGKRSVS